MSFLTGNETTPRVVCESIQYIKDGTKTLTLYPIVYEFPMYFRTQDRAAIMGLLVSLSRHDRFTKLYYTEYPWRKTDMKTNQWTFINTLLSEGERESFEIWEAIHGGKALDDVLDFVLNGYKFTTKHHFDSGLWYCTFVGTNKTKPNLNSSLTAQHATFGLAIALLIYKATKLSDNGLWRDDRDNKSWG